jgi:hypothetical protein
MRRTFGYVLAGLLLFVASPAWAQPQPAAAPAEPFTAAPYQKVVEDESGGVSLQLAVRRFTAGREGLPEVFLAGAVHIGRPEFYRSLQEFLDAQDVVLFEGVKPPGAGDPDMDEHAPGDDRARSRATERRIRFLAMAVERFRARNQRLPESWDDLTQGSGERIGSLLAGATVDAWGRPLVYVRPEPAADQPPEEDAPRAQAGDQSSRRAFDILSPGPDGQTGDEHSADDLRFSQQKPLSRPETGDRSEGLQQKLADALGLAFQLTAMDHDRPNWRNSDLAVDQVQARLERAGANADELFKMLDGSSIMARFAGMFLGMMSQNPRMQAMLRIAMIETIGQADRLLASGAGPGGAAMARTMGVLLEDRNAVVLSDLRKLLESPDPPRTVGIIYGAGHLPTMEQRLVQELGYTPAGDTWRSAMEVRPGDGGITAAEIHQMRQTFSRMLDRQLKAGARP